MWWIIIHRSHGVCTQVWEGVNRDCGKQHQFLTYVSSFYFKYPLPPDIYTSQNLKHDFYQDVLFFNNHTEMHYLDLNWSNNQLIKHHYYTSGSICWLLPLNSFPASKLYKSSNANSLQIYYKLSERQHFQNGAFLYTPTVEPSQQPVRNLFHTKPLFFFDLIDIQSIQSVWQSEGAGKVCLYWAIQMLMYQKDSSQWQCLYPSTWISLACGSV